MALPLALAALAATPPAALAGPSPFTFADGVVTWAPELIARGMQQQRAEICTTRRRAASAPSLAASLRAAERVAGRGGRRRALARFARSGDGRTPARATAAAAAAATAGKETAALAALLRAHELAPRDPRPLVSAAALMANVGRPREALGLLAGAARLRGRRVTPLGIPSSALLATNRGWALIGLGQWAAAEKELAKAARQAPFLSEAKVNLAHAQLCQGRFAAAARSFSDGKRRQTPREETTVRSVDEADRPLQEQLASDLWLDLSRGVDPRLPTYRWPASEAEGKGMRDALGALHRGTQARIKPLADQVAEASKAFTREAESFTPATQARIESLWLATSYLDRLPSLRATYLEYQAKEDAARNLLTRYGSGQSGTTCGEGPFQERRQALIALDDATRAWVRAEYRRTTAIAANAATPKLHEALMLRARLGVAVHMSGVLQHAAALAYAGWVCHRGPPVVVDPGADTTETPDSLSCPDGLAGKAFKVKLGRVLSISLECEKATLEVDAGGWIGVFANVSHNVRRGDTTVFMGPRAKVSTPGPLGPGATIKDGFYVTVSRGGTLVDVGARVEQSVSFAADQASAQVKVDAMDFSLVGFSPIRALTFQPQL